MIGLTFCSRSMLGRAIAWGGSEYEVIWFRGDADFASLAYTEMRLILARVIYNFDMKLADDSTDWLKRQKVWFFWNRPALNVYLTPVKR